VAEAKTKQEPTFDASKYVLKLRGKDYIEVKWRLVWLRTLHPQAVVVTEMVSHDLQRQMAVFKALVNLPDGSSATGWGQEEAKDFGDYIEKAETKALGRALAHLGMGTQFAGLDEGMDGGNVVDSPVDRQNPVKADGKARGNGVQVQPPKAAESRPSSGNGGSGGTVTASRILPTNRTMKIDGADVAVFAIDRVECYLSETHPTLGAIYATVGTCPLDGHGDAHWKTWLQDGVAHPWRHRMTEGVVCAREDVVA
jgi:hypothetical protein